MALDSRGPDVGGRVEAHAERRSGRVCARGGWRSHEGRGIAPDGVRSELSAGGGGEGQREACEQELAGDRGVDSLEAAARGAPDETVAALLRRGA
jgi:hypothetical protein